MTKDSKKRAPKSVGFETNLGKLEQIITRMEEETTPLNESLELFEQGIALSRQAQESLSQAEQKIRILTQDDDKPVEERFIAPDND